MESEQNISGFDPSCRRHSAGAVALDP